MKAELKLPRCGFSVIVFPLVLYCYTCKWFFFIYLVEKKTMCPLCGNNMKKKKEAEVMMVLGFRKPKHLLIYKHTHSKINNALFVMKLTRDSEEIRKKKEDSIGLKRLVAGLHTPCHKPTDPHSL